MQNVQAVHLNVAADAVYATMQVIFSQTFASAETMLPRYFLNVGWVCVGATPSLHKRNSLTVHPRHWNVFRAIAVPGWRNGSPPKCRAAFPAAVIAFAAAPTLTLCPTDWALTCPVAASPWRQAALGVHKCTLTLRVTRVGRHLPSGGLAVALRCGVRARRARAARAIRQLPGHQGLQRSTTAC